MDRVIHYKNGYGVKIVVNENDTFTLTMLEKINGIWTPGNTITISLEQLDDYLMVIRSKS